MKHKLTLKDGIVTNEQGDIMNFYSLGEPCLVKSLKQFRAEFKEFFQSSKPNKAKEKRLKRLLKGLEFNKY